jgi:flagellar protein FlbD
MIQLTKINNALIVVNSDLIEYIEETPDTVITLTNNDRVVVQERTAEIIERIVHFRRQVSGLVDGEYQRKLRQA